MKSLTKSQYPTLLYQLLCWLLIFQKCSAAVEPDGAALLAFKDHITADPHGILTSWNDSTHFCYWQGVSCSSRRFGRVTALNLEGKNLAGTMAPQIANLSFLRTFNLYSNLFRGEVPGDVGRLTRLRQLNLGQNSFQGSIPSEMGRLSSLELLQMGKNNFSGRVPPSIYNLSSLQYLDISENRLYGEIPADVGSSLHNLREINVAYNHFTGLIPASLSNASRLREIMFTNNSFTGRVPRDFGSLEDLRTVGLGANKLDNQEDEDFDFLTSLTNCSKLHGVDISSNMFHGVLPSSIANLSRVLSWFCADDNRLWGGIPQGIESLSGLQILVLSDNMITGEIPTGIGKLKELGTIRLARNRISGLIPSSLGNITQLFWLDLRSNDLEGSIPPSLGNCERLDTLRLDQNKLSGSLHKEVMNPHLTNFSLARNFLTGELPPEVGNMSKLLELDVSGNRLSGEIPRTIGGCEMLEKLNLGNNSFQGSILSALRDLKNIHAIDLSRNNFSGRIPMYIQNFTILEYLNLSYNNLEGEVPKGGIFANQSGFSIVGNGNLCGGPRRLGLPECQVDEPKRKRFLLVLIAVISTIISCFVVVASLYFIRKRRKEPRENTSSKDMVDEHFMKITYAELFQATNGFSSSNLIGRGGCSSVYRGALGGRGMTVAVKVFDLGRKGVAKSFMAECDALKNIRHRNLVKIITVCSSIDFRGDPFKALVFEFMPNGSLEEWLHHGDSYKKLGLAQRMSVAIDVARALEYLHHGCGIPIVHGDLKPSNILLDLEMVARVGDFGLSRVLSGYFRENSSVYPASSSGFQGTIGYVAPEYGTGGMKTLQGDIYGFGIMLLEIFTGIKPTADIFKNGMDLHQHVESALPERIGDIIQPSILLEDGGGTEKVIGTMDCLIAILRVGILCSVESPAERMGMKDVVIELTKIKEKCQNI